REQVDAAGLGGLARAEAVGVGAQGLDAAARRARGQRVQEADDDGLAVLAGLEDRRALGRRRAEGGLRAAPRVDAAVLPGQHDVAALRREHLALVDAEVAAHHAADRAAAVGDDADRLALRGRREAGDDAAAGRPQVDVAAAVGLDRAQVGVDVPRAHAGVG